MCIAKSSVREREFFLDYFDISKCAVGIYDQVVMSSIDKKSHTPFYQKTTYNRTDGDETAMCSCSYLLYF